MKEGKVVQWDKMYGYQWESGRRRYFVLSLGRKNYDPLLLTDLYLVPEGENTMVLRNISYILA